MNRENRYSRQDVPLWNFAYHPFPSYLDDVSKVAKKEPWGKNKKVLELYLRTNFEIAKEQSKVFEDKKKNLAFWRAGKLVNVTSDPIWIVYRKSTKGNGPYWSYYKTQTGDSPNGDNPKNYEIEYQLPEFNSDWTIYFEQQNISHILLDTSNKKRLEDVFKDYLTEFNEHLIFRAIYGEIQLKRKEGTVLPQRYHNNYAFVMPLFLTQPSKVDLTAALVPDIAMKRYVVKTLLLPYYAYAYTRSVVKSRDMFAEWMLLSEEDLEKAQERDENEEE